MTREEAAKMIESIGYWGAEIAKVCDQELKSLKHVQHLLDGHRVLDRYRALQTHIDRLKKQPIHSFERDHDGEPG